MDVTIQAQILNLMRQLKERLGTAIIMIAHDLGVIAEMADSVLVMYAGLKAEEAPARELFDRPMHPYTLGLMASIPRVNATAESENGPRRLQEIPGVVPSLREEIPGCAFAPHCGQATERCSQEAPPPVERASGHWVACWENGHMRSTTYA
jgi:peptide/nickel transport system ATP-binding protein